MLVVAERGLCSTPNLLALLCSVSLACASSDPQFRDPGPRATLGEAVYEIIESSLATAQACTEQKLASLALHRADLIATINAILTDDTVAALPTLVEASLLPLVDGGALPTLTDELARHLERLVDNPNDPHQQTLKEMMDLTQSESVISSKHLLTLADRVLIDSSFADTMHALAGVANAQWKGTPIASLLLPYLGRRFQSSANGCTAFELDHMDLLLQENGKHRGETAWAVLADGNGNPKVQVNPTTGTLYLPFLDLNLDGHADIDLRTQPIDVAGIPIDIDMFGRDGFRDVLGRALSLDGSLLYDYFNVFDSSFEIALQLAAEALEAGMHRDFGIVLEAVMGEPLSCGESCWTYPANDNPAADLAFAVIEDLRYQRIATLLSTWRVVTRDDPQLAESVIVSVGNIIAQLDRGGLKLTDQDLIDLFVEAMPLFADVFERDNTTGESTARLLLDVVHELAQVARELPRELAIAMRYSSLHKPDACGPGDPDLGQSEPILLDKPRFYEDPLSGWTDNRSGLEKAVELLASADCGSVPFTDGKSVAAVLIEIMADLEAEPVCSIIDSFLGVLGLLPSVGKFVAVGALGAIGCDGEAVYADLMALDTLAKGGLLDVLLPVAKAFVDRVQLDTMLAILHLVGDDLRRDEAAGPAHSAVRRALPSLIKILESGAVDSLFDLDDILVTVAAVDGSGTLAEVIVDSFEYVTDDTGKVRTRRGLVPETSLALEMLHSYREIVTRLRKAGKLASLAGIIRHMTGYLSSTTADGRLADDRLMPLLNTLLEMTSGTFDVLPTQRRCIFDRFQESTEAFLTDPDFATTVGLLRTYTEAPERQLLDSVLIRLMRPSPGVNIHGPMSQVLSGVVQTRNLIVGDSLSEYVTATLADLETEAPHLLDRVDSTLASDTDGALVEIIHRLIDPGAEGLDPPSLAVFSDTLIDVAAVRPETHCVPGEASWTTEEVASTVRSIIDFLRDDRHGMGGIYALLSLRAGP